MSCCISQFACGRSVNTTAVEVPSCVSRTPFRPATRDDSASGTPEQVALDLDVLSEADAPSRRARKNLSVDLEAGPQVLICNYSAHYQSGTRHGLQRNSAGRYGGEVPARRPRFDSTRRSVAPSGQIRPSSRRWGVPHSADARDGVQPAVGLLRARSCVRPTATELLGAITAGDADYRLGPEHCYRSAA